MTLGYNVTPLCQITNRGQPPGTPPDGEGAVGTGAAPATRTDSAAPPDGGVAPRPSLGDGRGASASASAQGAG